MYILKRETLAVAGWFAAAIARAAVRQRQRHSRRSLGQNRSASPQCTGDDHGKSASGSCLPLSVLVERASSPSLAIEDQTLRSADSCRFRKWIFMSVSAIKKTAKQSGRSNSVYFGSLLTLAIERSVGSASAQSNEAQPTLTRHAERSENQSVNQARRSSMLPPGQSAAMIATATFGQWHSGE